MKKSSWVLLSLIVIVLFLNVIRADIVTIDPSSGDSQVLGIDPNNAPQTPEEGTAYLKQEWGKILAKTTFFGPIINFYNNKLAKYLNPVLKYTLGVDPSISWLFFITLVLWISLVIYFYRILSVFSTFSNWVSLVVSILSIIIMSNMHLPRWIAEKIINMISLAGNKWVQLGFAILFITALILASIFSKEFEKLMKTIKENRKKMKQAQDIEEAKMKADAAYNTTEAIGEAFKS